MTPKERLLNILEGKPTDRIPIYTQIPFAVGSEDWFKESKKNVSKWMKHA